MEDVLEVYHRPYEADFPVVCMDEQPVQLTKETRIPLPMEPSQPQRYDHEYERNGTACIFMFCEPKAGVRTVCKAGTPDYERLGAADKNPPRRTIPKRKKGRSGMR